MAGTVIGDVVVPEVLELAVKAKFAGGKAFMQSGLASSGAVIVKDGFYASKPRDIGAVVTIPYWGSLPDFTPNPDGSSAVVNKIKATPEQAVVARESLAFAVSEWSRGAGSYEEAADQLAQRASLKMDRLVIAAACASLPSMTHTITAPGKLNWDGAIDARSKFGDATTDIAAICMHSTTEQVLTKERTITNGQLLLVDAATGRLKMIGDMPVVVSDAVPVVGTAGAVTAAGTTPPTVTITGTSNRALKLRVECTLVGARGVWTGRYSTDDAASWVTFTSAATVVVNDSYLSQECNLSEATGLTINIATGNAALDNAWTAETTNRYTSCIVKKAALAFWYNANALVPKSQPNVLDDTEITASHLYYAAHRYKRAGGVRPGVVPIVHS